LILIVSSSLIFTSGFLARFIGSIRQKIFPSAAGNFLPNYDLIIIIETANQTLIVFAKKIKVFYSFL